MTSELADTLLGLRWPLPRTDHDARAALDQLAQVSGRLTELVADPQVQQDAPSWLGPVQALIAQGGFTLDWWQPLLAEPELDWTVNHQAHLSADLAQIAAAGARILDQLQPSGGAPAPSPVVRSVASFGSVPMAPPRMPPAAPGAPKAAPGAPPPTGRPVMPWDVAPLRPAPAPPPRSGPNIPDGIPAQPQPPRFESDPARAPLPPFEPEAYQPPSSSYGGVSDPLSDSGRHRRSGYEYAPPEPWGEAPAERAAAPDPFPAHVQPYPDDEDDEDPILAPGRRLPAHAGMIAQATIVLCVVGALSWWAVGELHKPSAPGPAAAGPSPGPTPSAAPVTTAAAGLNPGGSATQTAPSTQTQPPAAGSGSVTVSKMNVLLEGGSKSDPYIDVILTFAASNTDAVTITIDYYGTKNGSKVSPQTSVLHESGQTGYQVGTTIPSSAYCGTTVTVVASAGSDSTQATTDPGC